MLCLHQYYEKHLMGIIEMAKAKKVKKQKKSFVSQQSLNSEIKSICDIMRRSNCAGAMQYVPELTWLLFLRILDANEKKEESEAKILGIDFIPSLQTPYRWSDWGNKNGEQRNKLVNQLSFLYNEQSTYINALPSSILRKAFNGNY